MSTLLSNNITLQKWVGEGESICCLANHSWQLPVIEFVLANFVSFFISPFLSHLPRLQFQRASSSSVPKFTPFASLIWTTRKCKINSLLLNVTRLFLIKNSWRNSLTLNPVPLHFTCHSNRPPPHGSLTQPILPNHILQLSCIISSFSEAIHCFTDGSKKGNRVGLAYPISNTTFTHPSCNSTYIFTAELLAIFGCPESITTLPPLPSQRSFLTMSDSFTSLLAIQNT